MKLLMWNNLLTSKHYFFEDTESMFSGAREKVANFEMVSIQKKKDCSGWERKNIGKNLQSETLQFRVAILLLFFFVLFIW